MLQLIKFTDFCYFSKSYEMYCFDLTQVVYKLSTDFDAGDWVVVVYENEWYPGIIQEVSKNYTIYKCFHFGTFH